jgi:hypothetical protein
MSWPRQGLSVVSMSSIRPIRPIRAIVLTGSLAAILLAAAGCGLVWNTLSDGLVQDDPVTEVHITGGSGDVTVIGDSTTGVDVRRTVRYVGDTRPVQTMSVTGGVLSVNTGCGPRCSASYEVHVSKGIKVTGKNDSGRVSARGVSDVDIEVDSGDIEVDSATGSVSAKADSGRVRVTDVGGSVTLAADSGDVEITGVSGKVSVTVGSGRIEATNLSGDATVVDTDSGDITVGLRTAGNLTVHAGSGRVSVTAPEHCCRLEVSAGSGHEDIRIQQNPTSSYLLNVRTGSGDITVKAG